MTTSTRPNPRTSAGTGSRPQDPAPRRPRPAWRTALSDAVAAHHLTQPLSAGVPLAEAAHAIGLPAQHATLVPELALLGGALVAGGGMRSMGGRDR